MMYHSWLVFLSSGDGLPGPSLDPYGPVVFLKLWDNHATENQGSNEDLLHLWMTVVKDIALMMDKAAQQQLELQWKHVACC